MSDISHPELHTPWTMCTCLVCGPPWRDETENWKQEKFSMWMSLCPECGNKRCPGAVDHTLPCSHSNDFNTNQEFWKIIHPDIGPTDHNTIVWYDKEGNRHENGTGVFLP